MRAYVPAGVDTCVLRTCARAFVRSRMRACARACVCVCVSACVVVCVNRRISYQTMRP